MKSGLISIPQSGCTGSASLAAVGKHSLFQQNRRHTLLKLQCHTILFFHIPVRKLHGIPYGIAQMESISPASITYADLATFPVSS